MRRTVWTFSVACVVAAVGGMVFGQVAGRDVRSVPARFTDPERRAKLSAAFGDIDRAFREFTTRSHVPGAAWGIIVDGELVHSGATGYRDAAAKAAAAP